MKNIIIWTSALLLGAVLGWLGIEWLNSLLDFIATIYTKLFQFVAVPTIALAILTTLSSLGGKKETGRIFLHTISYTLLTTIAAAVVGLVLYLIICPENLPADVVATGQTDVPENLGELTYYDHILSIIPNNVIEPFAKGNVLSILLVSGKRAQHLARQCCRRTGIGFYSQKRERASAHQRHLRTTRGSVHPHPRSHLDIAAGHRGIRCTTLSTSGSRRCHRFIGTICGSHHRWQSHPVLHSAAPLPAGKRAEPMEGAESHVASRAHGTLHQKQRRHPACHDAVS